MFKEPEWRNFFWTPPTKTKEEEEAGNETVIKVRDYFLKNSII